MDITGGEVFENQDVLQIGYGRAQKLLSGLGYSASAALEYGAEDGHHARG